MNSSPTLDTEVMDDIVLALKPVLAKHNVIGSLGVIIDWNLPAEAAADLLAGFALRAEGKPSTASQLARVITQTSRYAQNLLQIVIQASAQAIQLADQRLAAATEAEQRLAAAERPGASANLPPSPPS